MAYENSPNLGTPSTPQVPLSTWIYQKRRTIAILLILAFVVGIAAIVFQIWQVSISGQPGGLDGCFVSNSGEPILAIVRIGSITRETSSDGCFFFPKLPPGELTLIVSVSSGEIDFPVTIISNEAVGIGTITITP